MGLGVSNSSQMLVLLVRGPPLSNEPARFPRPPGPFESASCLVCMSDLLEEAGSTLFK